MGRSNISFLDTKGRSLALTFTPRNRLVRPFSFLDSANVLTAFAVLTGSKDMTLLLGELEETAHIK